MTSEQPGPSTAAGDGWDPDQYRRFEAERTRPFDDLLALVDPVPGGAAVDLGCGAGALTARLHAHLGAASTVGIDSSPAMLAAAADHAGGGVSFEAADIATFDAVGRFDVVFSNAALHWVPDHPTLLARLARSLRPGGQLAVQVPANVDHPSHRLAADTAAEEPFRSALGGTPPRDVTRGVLAPERYAELLHELGAAEQHVRLQVYGHLLPSTAAVVEWTRGTTLVRFRRVLEPALFELFVDRYRQRLLAALGDQRPYFYAFRRILFRARWS